MAAVPRLADVEVFTNEAQRFAEELSTTVQAVAGPYCPKFSAVVSTTDELMQRSGRKTVEVSGSPTPASHCCDLKSACTSSPTTSNST